MNRKNKRKTIAAALLLAAVYVMIFQFSADSGDASSNISVSVTRMVLRLYYRLTGQGGGVVIPGAVDTMEGTIRKIAHFTEYMAVGFLSFEIAGMWIAEKWKGIGLVVIQLILSAALDELHQYFVPGRYASLKDVLIDTAGGIAGIMILLLWKKGKKQLRKQYQKIKKKYGRAGF